MNKDEYIERYGEEAWEKKLAQNRAWKDEHPEKVLEHSRKWHEAHPEVARAREKAWAEAHPEVVKENSREQGRKGGSRYEKHLEYYRTGLQGERNKVRNKHRNMYRPYKQIIAPDSQIHHSWFPGSSKYDCIALVESNAHRHGIVDVIEILKGEITIFSEEELRNRGELND